MSANQAMDLLQQVADRAEEMRQTGEADPFVAAASELVDQLKEQAKLDRVDALRNAAVRNRIMGQVRAGGGIAGAVDTLRSLLHGTNIAGRDSIQGQWRGLASGWQAVVENQLRKLGIAKAAVTGQLDQQVAREMWALNAGQAGPGLANSPERLMAQTFHPALDLARSRLNGAGARIADAIDFVAHTEHDPMKMRRAAGSRATPDQAFQAWWQAEQPRWAEKTFAEVKPEDGESVTQARARFARSIFEALVTGVRKRADGADVTAEQEFMPPAFEGTFNIARKVSQPRVIFYKDADAWTAHQQQFGTSRTLFETVQRSLDRAARQVALMDKLGTNPTANFNQVVERIQQEYRSDVDAVGKFQAKTLGLDNVLAHLDGRANMPVNRMAARIGASVRTLESTASLGGVGVTHFASIWPTMTSELAHHGISRLESMGKMVQALGRGRGTLERRDRMADLGAYAHGLTRDMHARWQAEDPIPGKISAMAGTFMKYTGIQYIFDNAQAAAREMLSHGLARNAGKAFGDLDGNLSQMIGKYGINEGEWDLLRNVPNRPTADGMEYITPKEALRTDPADVEALLRARGEIGTKASAAVIGRKVLAFQNTMADRLLSYYDDAAAHGVVTPGVRERALVLGQERPGTAGGEMRRFLLQFKMWPIAAANQLLGREIHMSLSRGQFAWNMGTMIALSAAAGYLRMAVNDVAMGRPVRNPFDASRPGQSAKVMLAALAQGGGLGIFGDFLFGETNRMGGGLVGTLGGPVIGDADQLIKIFEGWKQGKMGWPDLAHFAVRHIPFANLVYLKGTLDYMLWYHLYEAASPGWWERTNRRLAKEQGRTMTGYVPGQGVPWTPFNIGG